MRYRRGVNAKNPDDTLKQSETIRAPGLVQLPVFLEVARRRSFSAAARALGMSPSATSQAIARLEEELGVALLVRTTRSVNVTPAGERLLRDAGPAITTAQTALVTAQRGREEPSGVLRLSVPRIACRVGLLPVLAEYARRFPAVRTDVVVDDANVDIVREGFDAGVRPKRALQADMTRVQLSGRLRMVVVGSPRYVGTRGRPLHPRDLVEHACLTWRRDDGGEHRWALRERGRALEVSVRGPTISDDVELLLAAAEEGMGLAYVAEPEAARAIAEKRLVTVLDACSVELDGLYLYYPRTARSEPKLRALVSCVRAVARLPGRTA